MESLISIEQLAISSRRQSSLILIDPRQSSPAGQLLVAIPTPHRRALSWPMDPIALMYIREPGQWDIEASRHLRLRRPCDRKISWLVCTHSPYSQGRQSTTLETRDSVVMEFATVHMHFVLTAPYLQLLGLPYPVQCVWSPVILPCTLHPALPTSHALGFIMDLARIYLLLLDPSHSGRFPRFRLQRNSPC